MIGGAGTSGSRKTIPLALRLWSSRAPGFKGESDEVLKIINDVFDATGGKGIVVYDRGGDRPAFYGDFDVDASFKSQWRVVEGYLSRWRIEETIRFIKQEYGFENIRVHSYNYRYSTLHLLYEPAQTLL